MNKKTENKNRKKYSPYFILIVLILIVIACSENYLMNKFKNKKYTIYKKNESIQTEKILSPYGYKVHGIFNNKEEVFNIEKVDNSIEEQFNTYQGETCHLTTSSIKGEEFKDIVKYKIYAYDEKLNHITVESNKIGEEIVFSSPMEIGKYVYVFEIEFENKDKLVYSFYLNVLEMIDVGLAGQGVVESLAYADIENTNLKKVIYDKTKIVYYLNQSKKIEPIDSSILPEKILYIYKDNFINQVNVFIIDNKVILYSEFNRLYYELPDEFKDEFLELI